MKSRFLLPNHYRKIGWFIFIPFLILGIFSLHMEFEFDWLSFKIRPEAGFLDNLEFENFTNELAGIGVLVGLVFIAFAREKVEDEFMMKLRLESLVAAVLISYALLFLTILFVYGFEFLIALVYNVYTVLIIFIARFYWVKMRQNKMLQS
jgi:FlaA1/EpsC-like NDP-sugar epimerase